MLAVIVAISVWPAAVDCAGGETGKAVSVDSSKGSAPKKDESARKSESSATQDGSATSESQRAADHLKRGKSLLKDHKSAEAIKQFKMAMEADPTSWEPPYCVGLAYHYAASWARRKRREAGRSDRETRLLDLARKYYLKSVDVKPNIKALNKLALIAAYMKDYVSAREYLTKAKKHVSKEEKARALPQIEEYLTILAAMARPVSSVIPDAKFGMTIKDLKEASNASQVFHDRKYSFLRQVPVKVSGHMDKDVLAWFVKDGPFSALFGIFYTVTGFKKKRSLPWDFLGRRYQKVDKGRGISWELGKKFELIWRGDQKLAQSITTIIQIPEGDKMLVGAITAVIEARKDLMKLVEERMKRKSKETDVLEYMMKTSMQMKENALKAAEK